MHIAYVTPLERAWSRMKAILFRPFEIETWIVLGFASFLAGLGEGGGEGANSLRYTTGQGDDGRELRELVRGALDVLANPVWVVLIVFGAFIILALVVLFVWISSRGKFIFLDDVIHDRAAIVEPWRRFQRLGDSLFLWRFAFGAICFVLGLLIVIPLMVAAWSGLEGGWVPVRLVTVAGLAVLMAVFVIAALFVQMLLNNFVIPIMYRDDLAATAAWGRFLPLLGRQLLHFVLYAIFLFLLVVAVVAMIVVAGCATLCCGFLLLAIPYVGSVILLPISVTYRAYGPEFLAQFGPEWSVFPAPPAPPPVPEPPPA
jgi:hypothetical protein